METVLKAYIIEAIEAEKAGLKVDFILTVHLFWFPFLSIMEMNLPALKANLMKIIIRMEAKHTEEDMHGLALIRMNV
jgi:hypothetical protein